MLMRPSQIMASPWDVLSVIMALSHYNLGFGMFRDVSGCFSVIMVLSLYNFNYMSGCFGMFGDVLGCFGMFRDDGLFRKVENRLIFV